MSVYFKSYDAEESVWKLTSFTDDRICKGVERHIVKTYQMANISFGVSENGKVSIES